MRAPPAEVKRYCISAVYFKGEPALLIGEGPVGPDDGQWVRYEDHAAALAALDQSKTGGA